MGLPEHHIRGLTTPALGGPEFASLLTERAGKCLGEDALRDVVHLSIGFSKAISVKLSALGNGAPFTALNGSLV
jgi:hypothetical protein